jgi:subtilisin-like proprotein convertase family protein
VTESVISVTNDIIISDVNVTINLNHTWDGDIEIKLVGPDNTEVMLSNLNGGSGDNYTNTIFDSSASTSIASGTPPFTGTFSPDGNLDDYNGLSSVGDWKLVVTDRADGDAGTLLDWTIQLCANTALSIDAYLVDVDAFDVIYKGNDQYLVKLKTTSINERLDLTVRNVLGQTLLWKTIENETGQGYEYNLDMSYVSSGIYFVRVGNNRAGNIKRIIVN